MSIRQYINIKHQNLKGKIFIYSFVFFVFSFLFFNHPILASVFVENNISIKSQTSQNIVVNNKEQKIKEGISKAINQIRTTINGKTVEDLKVQSNGENKKVSKIFKDKNSQVNTNVFIKKENLAIKKIEAPAVKEKTNSSFLRWLLHMFKI
ncbi:MAG: hypothetical protein ABIJ94_04230 [candidate division WOR-3 bacterium]